MDPTLASLYAAGAVDADLDLPTGRLDWRDLGGRLVGRAEGAVVLSWDPVRLEVTWAMEDLDLSRLGAAVVPALDTSLPEGAIDRATAADLAASAAAELGYTELVRIRDGQRLRFVAIQELQVLRSPCPVPDRLRAIAAYLRGGGDPEDASWRLQALALDVRHQSTGQAGVAGLVLSSLAAGLEHTARQAVDDPHAAAASLEEAAAGLSGGGSGVALETAEELLAGVAAWMQSGGRDDELALALRQALDLLSQRPDAEERMGRLLDVARKQGVPFEHLATALQRLLPTSSSAAGLWRAVAAAAPAKANLVTLYNLGLALRTEAGAAKEAVELLARARDQDPLDAEVWFELGNARWDVGDNREALAAWDRASQLDATMPGPWINRGRLLRELDDLVAARQAYERAAELSGTPEVWQALGGIQLELGDTGAGRHSLQQAIAGYSRRIDQGQGPDYQRFWRGAALAALGQVDEGLADLEQALLVEPRWAQRAREEAAWLPWRSHPRFKALVLG